MRRLLISTLFVGVAGTLTGCSSNGDGKTLSWDPISNALDRAPFIYRPTIQQGNEVTQDQVNQLKPGMSRRQVQFILGSPTMKDAFHNDRWDYPFTLGVGSTPDEYRRIAVFFEDDRLVRISGDLHPQPAEEQEAPAKPSVVKVPDWDPEPKSLIGKALDTVGLDGDDAE